MGAPLIKRGLSRSNGKKLPASIMARNRRGTPGLSITRSILATANYPRGPALTGS